jgi:TRAP-type mannitol/chloroaromatic compound transport system substrate-binding protein
MANVNAPFGFSQASGTGSSPTYENVELPNGGIDYNTSAIYQNDPVIRTSSSDGTISRAATAGGVTLAGIFLSCKYLSTAQKRLVWSNYWPGSDVSSGNQSTIAAYIVNDPNAQFLVQTDGTGATQAQMGSNVDLNIGTGSTANGFSGAYITPGTTAGTTAALPFRMNSLYLYPPGANGTAAGAYNWVYVAFNNVETRQLTSVVA